MEVRILVGKLNIYDAQILTTSFVQIFWLETTLFLNNLLTVNKKFLLSQYYYWNLGTTLNFMCSTTNINYNLWYSRTQCQLLNWFLCSSWCSFFAFWGAEKHVFHISLFRSTCYVLKIIGCLVVSTRVSNWNKGKNLFFVESIL